MLREKKSVPLAPGHSFALCPLALEDSLEQVDMHMESEVMRKRIWDLDKRMKSASPMILDKFL